MFDLEISVRRGVFHPRLFFSTRILARHLLNLPLAGKEFLEIGPGSGVLSLLAARQGARVTAVDINREAVSCSQQNAELNGLADSVTVMHGDLFDPVQSGAQFDYIVWNPPFYPKPALDEAEMAWNAGEDFGVVRRFLRDALGWLSDGGRIVVIMPDNSETRSLFYKSAWSLVIAEEEVRYSWFDQFRVITLTVAAS